MLYPLRMGPACPRHQYSWNWVSLLGSRVAPGSGSVCSSSTHSPLACCILQNACHPENMNINNRTMNLFHKPSGAIVMLSVRTFHHDLKDWGTMLYHTTFECNRAAVYSLDKEVFGGNESSSPRNISERPRLFKIFQWLIFYFGYVPIKGYKGSYPSFLSW